MLLQSTKNYIKLNSILFKNDSYLFKNNTANLNENLILEKFSISYLDDDKYLNENLKFKRIETFLLIFLTILLIILLFVYCIIYNLNRKRKRYLLKKKYLIKKAKKIIDTNSLSNSVNETKKVNFYSKKKLKCFTLDNKKLPIKPFSLSSTNSEQEYCIMDKVKNFDKKNTSSLIIPNKNKKSKLFISKSRIRSKKTLNQSNISFLIDFNKKSKKKSKIICKTKKSEKELFYKTSPMATSNNTIEKTFSKLSKSIKQEKKINADKNIKIDKKFKVDNNYNKLICLMKKIPSLDLSKLPSPKILYSPPSKFNLKKENSSTLNSFTESSSEELINSLKKFKTNTKNKTKSTEKIIDGDLPKM